MAGSSLPQREHLNKFSCLIEPYEFLPLLVQLDPNCLAPAPASWVAGFYAALQFTTAAAAAAAAAAATGAAIAAAASHVGAPGSTGALQTSPHDCCVHVYARCACTIAMTGVLAPQAQGSQPPRDPRQFGARTQQA